MADLSMVTLSNTEHASIEKNIHKRQQSLDLAQISFEDIIEEASHLEQSNQATDLASSFAKQIAIQGGTLDALNMYTKSLRNSVIEDPRQSLINLNPIPASEAQSPPVRRQLIYEDVEVIEADSYEIPAQIHSNIYKNSPEMPD